MYILVYVYNIVYNEYKSKKYLYICLKGALFIIFANNCLLYIYYSNCFY